MILVSEWTPMNLQNIVHVILLTVNIREHMLKLQNIVNNVICEFESCHTIYFLLKATFYDSIYRHCVHA